MNPTFLTLADVVAIHRDMIARYGGAAEIRDPLLLQSAVAQPQASFGGDFLHRDLYEMASAYLYHIVQNHPFLDGNKRTGGAASLVFLFLNGVKILVEEDVFAEMVLSVAMGKMDKASIATFLRDHAHSSRA